MRYFWLWFATAAIALTGCRPKGVDEPSGELWLRVHCAGANAIARDTNSAKLRTIAALPASVELRDALAQRFAVLFQQSLTGSTNRPSPDGSDLIVPLLNEALTREFIIECHGRSNQPTSWLLAVSLEGDMARRWETNYRTLVARLNLGEVKKFNARSFGGWYVTLPDKHIFDYLEIGKWVIVGTGTDRRPLAATLQRTDKEGRPLPALDGEWLRAQGDLARFHGAIPAGDALAWPQFDLTLNARNTNLVAVTKLTFPEPLRLDMPAWNVPTNLVEDPVISFTAVRGIAGLVQSLPFYQRLGLTNAPRQAVFWAQTQIPFQSHVVVPTPHAQDTLEEIARRLPAALGTNMQSSALGQIRWATNHSDLIWAGLPIVVPFLRAASAPDGSELLFGGLFPPRNTGQPLPTELLDRLARTNLVYYDWEITEARLQQWRQLWQLWALVTFMPALEKPIAEVRWLDAVGPQLGNAVTEISQRGPRELTFVRKSHLGFTAIELIVLSRQLDEFISGPPPPQPVPRVRKMTPAP